MLSPRLMPDFLASFYRPGALETVDATLAALDAHGAILWVNEAWYRFARDNGSDFTFERYPSYFDGISGPLRGDYERVVADVIATSFLEGVYTTPIALPSCGKMAS